MKGKAMRREMTPAEMTTALLTLAEENLRLQDRINALEITVMAMAEGCEAEGAMHLQPHSPVH